MVGCLRKYQLVSYAMLCYVSPQISTMAMHFQVGIRHPCIKQMISISVRLGDQATSSEITYGSPQIPQTVPKKAILNIFTRRITQVIRS